MLVLCPVQRAQGTNATGYDPATDELVALFNPRADRWADHFAWDGPLFIGKTTTARATIDMLRINQVDRVDHRRVSLATGQLALGLS
ncbi:MAG TPA: hypothetical protein VL371_15780 [Gemmataceae bacterium]|nr:hypothetical protein [Gemmataceae bacterium]